MRERSCRTRAAACSCCATAWPTATSRDATPPSRRTSSSWRSIRSCGSSRTRATSSPSSTRTSRRRLVLRARTWRTSGSGKGARTSSTRWPSTSSQRGRSPTVRSSRSSSAEGGLLELVFVDELEVCRVATGLGPLLERDRDPLDPVSLHLEHVEPHPVVGDVVARLRRPPELAEHEAGDRVEVLVRQVGAEAVVELVDREHPVHPVRVFADLLDGLLGHVELVLDLAHDLLEQVLERRDADHRAVLVDDHGEVVVRAPELLQQRGEVFGLWNDVRRPEETVEADVGEPTVE